MLDPTAIPIEKELTESVPTRALDDARNFVTGVSFTVAIATVGTILFTLALLIGVVGAPVIVLAVGYVVLRHRRAERARSWTAVGATGEA